MLQREIIDDAMRRALSLAMRSPADDPNPRVGCVILDPEGRIVAEGWHRGAGTPHAEIDALHHVPDSWRILAHELTAVVTLEPCNHTGLTGPCAEALTKFGVGAVAFALRDPGSETGGGAESLKTAGIEVLGGVLADQAGTVVAPWLAAQTAASASGANTGSVTGSTGAQPRSTPLRALREALVSTQGPSLSRPRPRRPRIIAKWAQTIDGRAAAANGTSQWITGPEARADVHRRRAEADAFLTGTGTIYADDPSLTARGPDGKLLVPAEQQPIPVVIGHRPIPPNARIRQHPALAVHGLDEPLRITGDDLEAELSTLARYRIYSVFIEGGPRLTNTLLAAGLVDEMLIYIAPALLGGPKVSVGHLGISDISEIRRLNVLETLPLGSDLLLRAVWHSGSSFPDPIARSFPTTAATTNPKEAR